MSDAVIRIDESSRVVVMVTNGVDFRVAVVMYASIVVDVSMIPTCEVSAEVVIIVVSGKCGVVVVVGSLVVGVNVVGVNVVSVTGVRVGVTEGISDGYVLGAVDGLAVGAEDGCFVGVVVGYNEGDDVGVFVVG